MTIARAKSEAAAAAAREARLQAVLVLTPAAMAPDVAVEWQRLAGVLADDPPTWSPSRRYAALLLERCVEACLVREYRELLKTPQHQIYRVKSAAGVETVKVSPYVALLEAALKRLRELDDMLELSPRGARQAKGSLFDVA
jgi:hypothetical protein